MGERRITEAETRRDKRLESVFGRSKADEKVKYEGTGLWKSGPKPKKEEAVQKLHEFFTREAEFLISCGIRQSYITAYVFEPRKYNSVVKALRWCEDHMVRKLDKLRYNLGKHTPEQWRALASITPTHSNIKVIYRLKKEVREEWKRRPRFPLEKGTLEEKGY